MNYDKLAEEMIELFPLFRKIKTQKIIDEAVHGEAFALIFIARQGCDVTPGEISQNVDVSAARVATILNSLEKKGLVTRQIDVGNRRRILVGITEDGKKAADEQQKIVMQTAVNMLEFLGEHDAAEHVRIMKRLTEIPPESWQ